MPGFVRYRQVVFLILCSVRKKGGIKVPLLPNLQKSSGHFPEVNFLTKTLTSLTSQTGSVYTSFSFLSTSRAPLRDPLEHTDLSKNKSIDTGFNVQSCRVVVNPSGLWSPGQRFESAQDYKNIFTVLSKYYFPNFCYTYRYFQK